MRYDVWEVDVSGNEEDWDGDMWDEKLDARRWVFLSLGGMVEVEGE